MSVLAVEIWENLDMYGLVEKIKDFANAQGWSVIVWNQDKVWDWTGSQYDFVAGDETFLAIESTGNGSQTLHFRLRSDWDAGDSQNDWLQLCSQNAANKTIDNGNASHPNFQNNWNTYYNNSLPPTIPRTWLFGNGFFLGVVCECDAGQEDKLQMLLFGGVDTFDSSEVDAVFSGYVHNSHTAKWYQTTPKIPFDNNFINSLYHDAQAKAAADWGLNIRYGTSAWAGIYHEFGRVLRLNSYSEVRPFAKATVYAEDDADSKWQPLGTFPVYRGWYDTVGDRIGQVLDYGSKQFYVFPNRKDLNYGIAFRTA